MDTEQGAARQTEREADGPEMQSHYSFKGGQRGRYIPLFSQQADMVRRSVTDILADALGHLAFQTAKEVVDYLQKERDVWERPWS